MPASIQSGQLSANGLDIHYLEAGSGPLALCLHGFPDTAHSWRFLLPALADAGFRAVAPFQRGYAPTSLASDGVYQSGALAADAVALHEAFGADDRAVVIGHDWGAAGAHGAAVLAPDRWRAVVTMAVPPGPAVAMSLMTNRSQLKRSWYMFLFQWPLAEMIVSGDDLSFIDMLWDDWSPGYDGAGDAARVKEALRDPARLSAALGYYRATLGDGPRDAALDDAQAATQAYPTQPLLYLHGRNDGCIGTEVAELAAASAPSNVSVEFVDNAGHFLQVEQPDLVNARIIEFLR